MQFSRQPSSPGEQGSVATIDRPNEERATTPHRQDLNGLRGLAIGLVVVFHVWFGRVSGGVDVFLVLSGYFFVGSLVRRAEAGGSLNPVPALRRVVSAAVPPDRGGQHFDLTGDRVAAATHTLGRSGRSTDRGARVLPELAARQHRKRLPGRRRLGHSPAAPVVDGRTRSVLSPGHRTGLRDRLCRFTRESQLFPPVTRGHPSGSDRRIFSLRTRQIFASPSLGVLRLRRQVVGIGPRWSAGRSDDQHTQSADRIPAVLGQSNDPAGRGFRRSCCAA